MKIKHLFRSLVLAAVTSVAAVSQVSAQNTVEVGTNVISLGIGSGINYYKGYNFGFAPTFSIGYQRGIWELGPGTVSLGVIGAFRSNSFETNDYRRTWNNFSVGPRAEWHYNFGVDNLDLYGGLTIALRIESYSATWKNGKDDDFDKHNNYGGTGVVGGLHLGGAYYFTPKVGIFAEFGYSINFFTFGVNFKI